MLNCLYGLGCFQPICFPWSQIAGTCYTVCVTYQHRVHWVDMKNFKKLVIEIHNLKKGIGTESQKNYASKLKIKVWKQVEDGMELNGFYRAQVNSKVVCYHCSDYICLYNVWYDSNQNRDSKCFKINFYSIATFEFHSILNLFPWSLTCLHSLFDFHSLFPI